MTNLKFKKFFGIKEIGQQQNTVYVNYPYTYFDLGDSTVINDQFIAHAPALAVLNSGWILDGKFIITDDGFILGEGFSWSEPNVAHDIWRNRKKLENNSDTEILTVENFSYDKVPINISREIDTEEIADTIFFAGFDNLSHFMMEIAPKSLLLSKILNKQPLMKNISFCDLVPKKWVDYTLKIAEIISAEKFGLATKFINSNKAVRFRNLIAVSSITYRSLIDSKLRMTAQEAQFFCRHMQKNIVSSKNANPYILYLSRKLASHRRTVNQDNLIKIIKNVYPDLEFVKEEKIHELSMEDQANLIFNANLVVEEGGGSTGFTSNLIRKGVPYVCITTTQRANAASSVYLSALGKYAAWVFGDPVGKLTKSPLVDNDVSVNEDYFKDLLVKLSFYMQKKISMPKIVFNAKYKSHELYTTAESVNKVGSGVSVASFNKSKK